MTLKQISLPFLKRLELYPIHGTHAGVERYGEHVPQKAFPSNLFRTGTVTTIVLSYPTLFIESIGERILHWPANLLHLSIDSPHATNALQHCIDLNSHSLKTIELGQILVPVELSHQKDPAIPIFSACVKLEKLTLSASNVVYKDGAGFGSQYPQEFMEKIQAPKLQVLRIDFHGFDLWGLLPCFGHPSGYLSGPLTTTDFGLFGKFAQLKSTHFASSNLKKIIAVHDPVKSVAEVREVHRKERFQARANGMPRLPWPWEYMARAEDEVENFGLEFEFEAHWSRAEWEMMMENCEEPYDFFEDRLFGLPGVESLFIETD